MSIINRITGFLRSPQGRRLTDEGVRMARSRRRPGASLPGDRAAAQPVPTRTGPARAGGALRLVDSLLRRRAGRR